MNEFVNLKSRSIELPNGAKDLADVLRARQVEVKCCMCSNLTPYLVPLGPGEEVRVWCSECLLDMLEFSALPENRWPGIDADQTIGAPDIVDFLAERKRREREFMAQRVGDRTLNRDRVTVAPVPPGVFTVGNAVVINSFARPSVQCGSSWIGRRLPHFWRWLGVIRSWLAASPFGFRFFSPNPRP
jgi:hypothetical protein